MQAMLNIIKLIKLEYKHKYKIKYKLYGNKSSIETICGLYKQTEICTEINNKNMLAITSFLSKLPGLADGFGPKGNLALPKDCCLLIS